MKYTVGRPQQRSRGDDLPIFLVGDDPRKRSTKTKIPSFRAALALSVLEAYAYRLAKRIGDKHFQETGERLTTEQVFERYSGPRSFLLHHRDAVEHFGSVDGFLATTAVRAMDALREDHRPESSIGGANGSKGGQQAQAAAMAKAD